MVSSRGSQHLCSLMAAVPRQSRAWALLGMHGYLRDKTLGIELPTSPSADKDKEPLASAPHQAGHSCLLLIFQEPLGKERWVPAFQSGRSLSHGSVHL